MQKGEIREEISDVVYEDMKNIMIDIKIKYAELKKNFILNIKKKT